MSNLIPQCLGLLVWGSPELATWLGNGTLYFHQSNAQSCFQGCCLMQWRWEERWGMSQEKMCFGDKLHRLAQSDSQSWERPVSAGLRWSEVTCPRYLGSEGQVWSSLASQWRLFTAKALFLQDLAEILLFRCLQPLWSCCSSSALGETLHFINTYERLWACGTCIPCLAALLAMLSVRNGHWITQHVLCEAGRNFWVAFSRGRWGVWHSMEWGLLWLEMFITKW